MRQNTKFYIDGTWVDPVIPAQHEIFNPTDGKTSGSISRGSSADVDRAVVAARRAFEIYSQTSRDDRLSLLTSISEVYKRRYEDVVSALCDELGAPLWLARDYQAGLPLAHLEAAMTALKEYPFEEARGTTLIRREAIGVCGMITPWNWPLHQIATKVVPALAMGCTMVLKPAELAPYSAYLFAEILHDAGVPAGVFNLVNGTGAVVGAAMSAHPDIDMMSFTGSTGAGIEVARAGAKTVKRVCQELGGKSANIVLDDADFAVAIPAAVQGAMINSGQTCSALTRLIVPASRLLEVNAIAAKAAAAITVGPPEINATMGPIVSKAQLESIQSYIQIGLDEGATLIAGGLGRPEGLTHGFYARPTIFSNVTSQMRIAREEIFGPVLAILTYNTIDEAVAIANDSPYGLSGGVQTADPAKAHAIAARLRTGQVYLNGAEVDFGAPFGGYKQSGNGREWGDFAFNEYIEIKAILGGAA
ncbi:aldehyde dehydrogenase family protein [Novosphingobium sp. Fuku2-ISO-50]|uniref:aldehyde dehydrogenase family protein n=1 Tax=Novosphingobium sp. Fuku2-ISO-50 TaxID=1739114 RepID=UPI00076CC2E4|nr:aldehyde dehydrogenase family protein [Novosphingobium sp. Fuku2-ISO-50]KUR75305.1 aldehyde dehydrogenase [Novosphingobium sp. Fuku2-ISO-50]